MEGGKCMADSYHFVQPKECRVASAWLMCISCLQHKTYKVGSAWLICTILVQPPAREKNFEVHVQKSLNKLQIYVNLL